MSITGWQNIAPTRVGMSLGDITASLLQQLELMQHYINAKKQVWDKKLM